MLRTKLAATLISIPFFFSTACKDDADDGGGDIPWTGGSSGDGSDGAGDDGGDDGSDDGSGDDGGGDDGSGDGGDDGSGDGGSDDGGSDDGGTSGDDGATTGGGGPCDGYRSEYPAGPYGTTVGSVLADVPGMVDGQGNPHDFFEIYQDRTVVAMVIANAFDT